MADITFVNNLLPTGGLSFNPGLEEVLDIKGGVGTINSHQFDIVNNDAGAFNGFDVQLTSDVNGGAGDFRYFFGLDFQPYGTITGITVRAPNGTVILDVTAGATGFGDAKLDHFYSALASTVGTPTEIVAAALGNLLSKPNVVHGSNADDHITAIGTGNAQLYGHQGNDILWSARSGHAEMAGGAGDDVLRVGSGEFAIHGANADGGGGQGQTNTLEILGSPEHYTDVIVDTITDIDVLRFVDPGPSSASDSADIGVTFLAPDLGPKGLSNRLEVHGSSTDSPFSVNEISIRNEVDPAATRGVSIDLSKWTFADWDPSHDEIDIRINSSLKVTVIGSTVADYIETGAGNDTIRGGRGADFLEGEDGNDTFVYGRHEAQAGEQVNGGIDIESDGSADKFLVLGNNDFSETGFWSIERLAFGGKATATFNQHFAGAYGINAVIGDSHANTLAIHMESPGAGASAVDLSDVAFKSWSSTADVVSIVGTKGIDTIAGTVKSDVINGGIGSDNLQGNGGADTFVFANGFGMGVDHIADFHRGEGDVIELRHSGFKALAHGVLPTAAFATGTAAHDASDRIIYDTVNGVLRYDDDGTGHHAAHIIAVLDDAATLKHGDILVI